MVSKSRYVKFSASGGFSPTLSHIMSKRGIFYQEVQIIMLVPSLGFFSGTLSSV